MLSIVTFIFIALFVIIAFMVIRVEHVGKRIKLVIFVILALLLYFSVASLFTSNRVDLSSPGGIIGAVYLYFGWMGKILATLWDGGKETVRMVGRAISFNMSG